MPELRSLRAPGLCSTPSRIVRLASSGSLLRHADLRACCSPCPDSICVSTSVAGLLFRSHASSKRNIIRNESNASRSRGFPAVVRWVGDTSSVSSGDGMLSRWEVGFLRGITRKAEGAA